MKTYNVNAYDANGNGTEGADFYFRDARETLNAAMCAARKLAKRNHYVEVTHIGRELIWDAGTIPNCGKFDMNRRVKAKNNP